MEALAFIGSVALDDGPIHFLHQIFYEIGVQVIGIARLACG